nr:sulfotransferase 16 [Tanacetum cinerariifolium]
MAIPSPPPITQPQNVVNTINDPLYIASSDHPHMVLTNTPFNEIANRYGQSNGPLIYQLERELSQITQDWLSRLVEKAKKSGRLAAHVNYGFEEHFHGDTPFDLGIENEVAYGQNGGVDQKLVVAVCQEMMKIFKGESVMEDKTYASTSQAGIMSLFTASFALFCHPSMNIKKDWVNDTGASDHVTPNKSLFISTTVLKKPISLHLPDAAYLINKMPMKKLQWKSPYEVLHKKLLTFDHLRVIGCLSYAAVTRPHKDKFDNRWINMPTFADEPFEEEFSPLPNTPLSPDSTTPTSTTHKPSVTNITEPTMYEQRNLNTPNQVPPTTTEPTQTRRSTRQSAKPSWFKDFVTFHRANAVSTVKYPLFNASDFKGIPHSHVVFLANACATTDPTSFHQAKIDDG